MEKDNKNFSEEIQPLRDEIDRIDGEIVRLLARRQAQVDQVTALKKAHHQPVFHPAREEDLLSRLREQARRAGLAPDFMEDLYRRILKQSRQSQTDHMGLRRKDRRRRVLVVGGNGQMGALFADFFQRSGHGVRILHENNWDEVGNLCADIDLALVSVPIEITGQVVTQLAPHLPATAILADLTSIKKAPLDQMLQSHPGPVMGLHPLFGPTTQGLEKQIVAVTPGRNPDQGQWLLEQLSLWGAILVPTSAEEHDRIMELVQALRHFATFCFGRFLHEKGADIQRTLEFSSPIYRLELGMVGRLFAQDAGLYARIIFATPERRALLKEYIDCLHRHREMLDQNDPEEFISQFNEIAQWFGPFSGQAMRESTFLINKLIERF
ncbi:MAG: bifunctional chorismate mutase/prephenate dehydrogenase [Desulfobacterales bacterium]|nr:bifunctional chorismate mutase/prephenate dehydrogenase [Desulfobacterales bacterium]